MRPFRTNLRDVPFVEGLSPREGWVNMQVQFLIDKKSANSDHLVLGWTVLPWFLKVMVKYTLMKLMSHLVREMLCSPHVVTGMASTTHQTMK